MKRMLSMALVVIGALACNSALALGLGELKLNSALNEKLDAEITITNVGDLSKNQLLPNLASHEDFARAGVERIFFLTSIKFDVTVLGNGNALLKLTTDKIVLEPYLNFLVEIHWPSGRLLREYTVLLDPPVYAKALAPVIKQSTVSAQPTTQSRQPVTSQQTRRDASSRVSAPSQNKSMASSVGEGADVRVKKNDTLWGIAEENRPSGNVSVRQTMVAIQRHNPNAFINNNINLLKAGQVLRIPNEDEVLKVSYDQALSETQRQNQEWQEKKKTIDATPADEENKTGSASQDVAGSEQVQLKLVSDEEAKASEDLASNASGSSTTGDSLSQEDTSGSNSSADEQTDPATSNMSSTDSALDSPAVTDDLQQQIEDLKRLVDLKDQQLALLQSSTSETDATSVTNEPVAAVDSMADETSPTSAEQTMDGNSITNSAMSIITKITDNPLYIAILILAILVVLMLIAVASRKRKQAQEYPADLRNTLDAKDEDVTFNEFIDDDLIDVADESRKAKDVGARPESSMSSANEIDDVLDVEEDELQKIKEEADIYIAYGRYERAVEVLQPAINDNPQNTELRLKLAEIFVANNNQSGLTQLEGDLQAIGDQEALDKFERMTQREDSNDSVSIEVLDDVTDDEVKSEDKEDDDKDDDKDKDLGTIDFELPSDVEEDDVDQKKSKQSDKTVTEVEEIDSLENKADDAFEIEEADLDIIKDDIDEKDLDKAGSVDLDEDVDDMDFLGDTDESATKIELAKAYIDMNDTEAALDMLNEVIEEGSDAQKEEARQLLDQIS